MSRVIAIVVLVLVLTAPAFGQPKPSQMSPEEARHERLERYGQIERSLTKLRADLQRTQVRLTELQAKLVGWAEPLRKVHIGGKNKRNDEKRAKK